MDPNLKSICYTKIKGEFMNFGDYETILSLVNRIQYTIKEGRGKGKGEGETIL